MEVKNGLVTKNLMIRETIGHLPEGKETGKIRHSKFKYTEKSDSKNKIIGSSNKIKSYEINQSTS